MPDSRATGGPESVGPQQPQTERQDNSTTGDIPSRPDRHSNAVSRAAHCVAGAAVAAAAAGTASTVAAVDRRKNVECGIHLNFTVTMDGGDSFDAVKAMGKAEAKIAATAVDEAGTGPAVDATRTVSRQTISRVHRTSHGIASDLAEEKEAPASAYCDVAAAALAVEDNAPDAADTETAEEAATLQAPDDALKLKAFASCSAPVAGGGPEVEHTSAASVEVARWGSSIPRMPGALREGFLAEVKSLQKKPIMKITTSVEGAYGESSVSSLFKLFSLLNKHFGLNEHSTFLDIGSGSGVPSLAAAAFGCTFTLALVDLLLLQQLYLGVQLDWQRTEECIGAALRDLWQPVGNGSPGAAPRAAEQGLIQRECRECHEGTETFVDADLSSKSLGYDDEPDSSAAPVDTAVGAGNSDRRLLETTLGFNAAFCVFDCSRLSSLEGISHVFSFDLAMPPWVMAHTVRLFNQSKTTFVFVSFHGDLISSFGMQAILATRLSMRMGTSAESHVGFVYQKIPKQRQKPTEAQQRHQQQREFPRTKQKLVAPVIADSANAAAECSGEDNKQIQRKQLQLQLVLLQRQLQELQQHQQQRRHPSKLQKQRQQLLRALEVTKEETLQVLQLMLHHQQQGLLLQQQLQLVALVQQEQGERGVSQAKLIEGAARLLEQQHLQEHQELVQKLSMQYWEESWRQQTLLKEATAAVAVQRLPAAPVGRSSALGSKVQQVRQELREKQKQLQNLEVMQLQDEQGQRKLEQHQRHGGRLVHQKSLLESRRFDDSNRLLEAAQQHGTNVQQKQRQQLLLLKGIASSRTDRILHSIAAAGRLQQMAQIFAAAVSMLPHPVSSQKEAIAARQQQKMPCCCSGCCYPVYRGNNEQPAAAAARVELMSAAHPQQQLLLLRRIFSAFQVDQLLERGSLMQEQQQQAITAARAEALLVHFRDVSVQGSDIDARTTPAGTAAGKENAAINMPYQCPCRQQNRCIGLSSGATNNSSNCTVCICGAAAALADLLPSIPCSRGYGVELQFCCQGQQQLQRKRLCRPIRRHGPSADSTTAASTTAPVTKMPSGRLPTKYDSDARSGGGAGCDTSSSVVVILPCLSPLCSACCYGDSLLLQLLRCSFPLAVQQQLLQQEVVMQQRMPLITVIDKQEQQQLEQKCMQDWKEAKMANLDLSAVPVAGAQANIRRGMVECPLEDTFDALQLLQQQLQQDHSQPMQVQHELGYGVTSETNCLEAAFRRHFEKLLEVQRHKMHLRGPARLRDQGQAPESVGHSDEEDEAIRQKRINLSVVVSPTSCKQERAGTPFQRQSKRPRRSKTLPGLSESLHVVADAALPTIGDGSTASAGSDFSSACCNEARVPVTISDDADGSKATVAIRLHPHEAQLLRACAVAAVKPTKFSCKRALQLLMQQRRLLQQHQSEGDKVEYVSPRTAGRDERRWVPNTASSLQLMSSNATWSAFSDSDCCSTHSSRSTCTSRSGKGTAGRRSALIAVAEEQLQQVRRHLVETQTALRQQLLLKLLKRDFSDHRVTNASSMEKGTVPVASSSCSCSPQLHLEQQEVLFKGGKGSCMWWRQYYMLLGELAVLKEKALYKAIDICLQEQQSPVSQALRGTQQQVQQQQLQRPREEQVKGTSVSANKTLVADGDEPNILKTSGMGCRLSDPLLQSPLAPRKRRSQGGF